MAIWIGSEAEFPVHDAGIGIAKENIGLSKLI